MFTHDEMLLIGLLIVGVFRLANKSRDSDVLCVCYTLTIIALVDVELIVMATLLWGGAIFIAGFNTHA